jgi:hypothetical protein
MRQDRPEDKVSLSYEKFTMPNGLQVVLHRITLTR